MTSYSSASLTVFISRFVWFTRWFALRNTNCFLSKHTVKQKTSHYIHSSSSIQYEWLQQAAGCKLPHTTWATAFSDVYCCFDECPTVAWNFWMALRQFWPGALTMPSMSQAPNAPSHGNIPLHETRLQILAPPDSRGSHWMDHAQLPATSTTRQPWVTLDGPCSATSY